MADIARWDPFDDSPFDVFPALFGTPARRGSTAWPRMDISETQDEYHLSVDMPGVRKDSIQVSVYADTVTIKAENREEKTAGEESNWLLKERSFGPVARSIKLPEAVDEAKAQARHADGVLYLTLPKKRSSAMKRLTVH